MEGHKRILVVDEDQGFIEGCSQIFSENSYQLQFVGNRQQAQQTINSGFDLIIIGGLSPAGESFMFQQWVKRHPLYGHIPLVVIDACFHERRWKGWRVFEGMQMDAEEYVSKPLEPIELLPLIEKLCTNIANNDHQTVETLWQAFLSLDEEGKDIFSNRVLQSRK